MQVFAALNAGIGLGRCSRVTNRVALVGCVFVVAALGLQRARAVGETRTISLHHVHTNEDLTVTYKRNGNYDEEALKKIDWILRDWRKNEAITMDRGEIDLLWEVNQEVGGKEPIQIICGYRAPSTNEMLRHRSKRSGVARFSQHTLGKAIDFYIPGVPLETVRATAMKLQGGGVGFYPTSGSPFVHLDVGNVRAWPRMTREQLVKLFPDGRTVHLPPDGKPLAGYQLALADIQHRHTTAAAPKKVGLLAKLFGRNNSDDDDDGDAEAGDAAPRAASPAPPAPSRTRLASADNAPPPAQAAAAATTARVPLPRSRPTFQIAGIDAKPVALPAPPSWKPVVTASLSPADVVAARGLWDGGSADGQPAGAIALDIIEARQRLATAMTAANADRTASIGPFATTGTGSYDRAMSYADAGAIAASSQSVGIANNGLASVVNKAIDTASSHPTAERLNDPWMRGVMLVATVQNSLIVTPIGDPDYRGLVAYMHKPASAVLMTFSGDPQAGLSIEQFTGSAVVFPVTVTFDPNQRTARLH